MLLHQIGIDNWWNATIFAIRPQIMLWISGSKDRYLSQEALIHAHGWSSETVHVKKFRSSHWNHPKATSISYEFGSSWAREFSCVANLPSNHVHEVEVLQNLSVKSVCHFSVCKQISSRKTFATFEIKWASSCFPWLSSLILKKVRLNFKTIFRFCILMPMAAHSLVFLFNHLSLALNIL